MTLSLGERVAPLWSGPVECPSQRFACQVNSCTFSPFLGNYPFLRLVRPLIGRLSPAPYSAARHEETCMKKSQHTERYRRLVLELKVARIRARMTQEQVTKKLKAYKTYISKVEMG